MICWQGRKSSLAVTENPELIQRAIEYVIAYETAVLCAEEKSDFSEVRRTVRRLYDKVEDK